MFGSKDLLFTSEKYGVAKSLRFRSSASAYLNRTFGTPTNGNIWTYSCWVKRGTLGTVNRIITAGDGTTSNRTYINFCNASNVIEYVFVSGGAATWQITSTPVFRDASAWYHVVFAVDTNNSTAANRFKCYVNGVEISFSGTPTQTTSAYINKASTVHQIGAETAASAYSDFYLAEVNFIDGQALTPSSFGFYDNNGIWQPKGYTGTYGTNGFYLKFTDVGATSGANSGYGKDFSGFNTNYWTTTNFNSTSTSTSYDSMYDSPVNASNGITGIGNYATLNPLGGSAISNLTISNANLTVTTPNATPSNFFKSPASIAVSSGKWYFESTIGAINANNWALSISGSPPITDSSSQSGYSTGEVVYFGQDGALVEVIGNNGSNTFTGTSGASVNQVIGVAFDADARTVQFYRQNSAVSTAQTINSASTYYISFIVRNNTTASIHNVNFGQRPFAYTPPSGYSALNTQNLSTPTITNGASYMAAVTYQGATAPNTVTTTSSNSGNNPNGVSFQPDLVWIKSRSAATDNKWTDAVRGTTKALVSNSTAAETTDTNGLTAFTASGFTVGSDTTYNNTTGPATYVAWEWNAGGSNATNTSGSITSTVRANTSAGFSVVTFINPTGTTQGTVGHGLGATPQLIIAKDRTTAGNLWVVFHASVCDTTSKYLSLSGTGAVATFSTIWGANLPTSSVFGVTAGGIGAASSNMVAYCFAPVSGYSAFGSYTGNGSTDGPFVYTGFRPRWIMFKASSTTGSWNIQDTSRDTYNLAIAGLYADLSQAEDTSRTTDILSNGFKFRGTAGNASGATYIYAAFAENPFKISRAR